MNTLLRLEQCLLPPPETIRWNRGALRKETYTSVQKIVYCVQNIFKFAALLAFSPFTLAYDYFKQKPITQMIQPTTVPLQPIWPPVQRGFATSLFQTAGIGTKWSATPNLAGINDWDKWMNNPKHIIHPEGFAYENFYTDILSNPGPYIEMLRSHHVTAHRFSLEWSVIEPRPGQIDPQAVALYTQFIDQLIAAGITPSITLCHFVVPEWFYESGNFQKISQIDHYVRFAMRAIELFPQVDDWWSFNELGVKAFQQAREVYPTDLPEGSSLPARVHAAGVSTRNMLIAHCQLHKEVARLYPQKKLGVTHQWLKFDTASGNWLERLFAYIFTKFGFSPVYEFFKEGRYSFQFPFMANIQFEIPKEEFEANGKFLMRLGVQAYPKPMVKMGLNHGQTYPGIPGAIKNLPLFSFGSSCEPGGTVMRFGPRHKAEAIEEILDDAFALTDQVFITEYGSDAQVQQWGRPGFERNERIQADYLRALTTKIRDYSERKFKEIKGIFAWSDLTRQMEWENGFECKLGMIHPIVDAQRRMVGWRPTTASEFLAREYFADEIRIEAV